MTKPGKITVPRSYEKDEEAHCVHLQMGDGEITVYFNEDGPGESGPEIVIHCTNIPPEFFVIVDEYGNDVTVRRQSS